MQEGDLIDKKNDGSRLQKLDLDDKGKSNLGLYKDIMKQRFLATDEAIAILQQINDQTVRIPDDIYKNPQSQQLVPPSSGDFLIFDIDNKFWKKDLHQYSTRKVSNAIQENRVKLKVNKQDIAVCSYCSGSGTGMTPQSFKRRAYWLIEQSKYILVHYLDDTDEKKGKNTSGNSGTGTQSNSLVDMTVSPNNKNSKVSPSPNFEIEKNNGFSEEVMRWNEQT